MPPSGHQTNLRTERRITVLASLYPKLKQWADRDGLTVADVVNAILLQNIRPYGTALPTLPQSPQRALPTSPAVDPYQTAVLDSW